MKYSLATLVSCSLSFNLIACIDPPTPLGLTESTFENESLSVNSRGIELGQFSIYFDETANRWCYYHLEKKPIHPRRSPFCGKRTVTLQNTGKTVGVALLDSKKKTVTLYQVKSPILGRDFEIDKTAAHIIFTEKSEGEYDRIEAKAVGPEGVLGSVLAEQLSGMKSLPPSPREKVDLRNAKVKLAGCSESSTASNAEPRVKPKSRFVVGADLHR